jgi:hypothetical protein
MHHGFLTNRFSSGSPSFGRAYMLVHISKMLALMIGIARAVTSRPAATVRSAASSSAALRSASL